MAMEIDEVFSVESLLRASDFKKEESLKNISVDPRPLDQLNDLGNLLGVEYNDLPPNLTEQQIYNRARDNMQLLINDIWNLPTERRDEVIVAQLPPPTTKIPREKPLPKPKPLTKWEEYAKSKGIVKKKKSNLVWDDAVREWIPRFGYKKAQAEVKKTWAIELKGNAPDSEDPFQKAIEEKKEKVAKNEIQRLKNLARAKKVKVPGTNGVLPQKDPKSVSSEEFSNAADLARKSTASIGKFQEKLSGKLEKSVKKLPGKKRKFDALVTADEKDRNLKVLETLERKKPKLDMDKAVGKQIHLEDVERSVAKKKFASKKVKGRKGRGGGGKKKRKINSR